MQCIMPLLMIFICYHTVYKWLIILPAQSTCMQILEYSILICIVPASCFFFFNDISEHFLVCVSFPTEYHVFSYTVFRKSYEDLQKFFDALQSLSLLV